MTNKLSKINPTHFFYLILGTVWVVLTATALFTQGTGGGGDSLLHYLYAHYAWVHPELFLDHWAKPLFTFLLSPFAQLGFQAMKVANVSISVLACWFTYRVAVHTQLKYPWLVVVLYFSSSLGINVALSGLTEPLFALLLIVSVYGFYTQRLWGASLLVSFLPFVRSEGLIVVCIVLVYLLVLKRFKYIPLLIAGHLVMGIAGAYHYGDLLWVFNKIPYASLHTNYWSGPFTYFIHKMPYIAGPVNTVCMALALLFFVWECIALLYKKKFTVNNNPFIHSFFLVFGIFLGFTFSHSLFYYLGIFQEMGLIRVFIGILPIMVLLALMGIHDVSTLVRRYILIPSFVKSLGVVILVSLSLFYVFGKNVFALKIKEEIFESDREQLLRSQLKPYFEKSGIRGKVYYSDPLIAYHLKFDLFENRFSELILQTKPDFKIGPEDCIIWDYWFSPIEEHIELSTLQEAPSLIQDKVFMLKQDNGELNPCYIIFRKRP